MTDKEVTSLDLDKYLDTGFYGDEEDGATNKKEKIVKCRKEHICVYCGSEIKKEQFALYETAFVDGVPCSCYTCLPCLDKWLKEKGEN